MLGKYHLQKLLATGGMGEVFLARQEGPASFTKSVVVKRLLRHLAADPAFVKMFLEEARLAALVTHPNVVQIFELGEEHGTYFIAMEYVRGRSLREVKSASPGLRLEPALAAYVAAQVLHGLHAAHTLVGEDGVPIGLVHRDVSPENVLVGFDGAVKLVDFGIAKAASKTSTHRTTLKGKYAYMAPEQYEDRAIDARTDVFACGVLLYELVCGTRPFTGASDAAVMHAILTGEPMPLVDLHLGVSPRLSAIVDTALAKDADDRHSSAEEMAKELEAWALDEGAVLSAIAPRARMRELFPTREPASATTPTTALTEPDLAQPATTHLTHELAAPTRVAPSASMAPPPRRGPSTPPSPGPATRRVRRTLVLGVILLASVAGVAATAAVKTSASLPGRSADTRPAQVTALSQSSSSAPPDPQPSSLPLDSAPVSAPPPSAADTKLAPRRTGPAAKEPKPAAGTMGSVAFRIRPWAEVVVDGRPLGITPLAPVELPAGRHVVVLRNKELGTERRVIADVPANGIFTLRVDLFK